MSSSINDIISHYNSNNLPYDADGDPSNGVQSEGRPIIGDENSSLSQTEARIIQLEESLLEALNGSNNSKEIERIKRDIETAQKTDISLRNETGQTAVINSQKRVNMLQYQILDLKADISRLQAALQDSDGDPDNGIQPRSVYDADSDPTNGIQPGNEESLQAELDKKIALKGTISSHSKFWEKVSKPHMQTIYNTSPLTKEEMIKGRNPFAGLTGLKNIIDLQKAQYSLLSGSGVIDADDDPSNGIQPIPGIPSNLHDIRQSSYNLQQHFNTRLSQAVNEPWFGEVQDIAKQRQEVVKTQLKKNIEETKKLKQYLAAIDLDGDPTNGVQPIEPPIGENGEPIDLNEIRQQLYTTRARVSELQKEKQFLRKIINPNVATPLNTTGDANGDDKIDKKDYRVLRAAAQGNRLLSASQRSAMDMNGDGLVNQVDLDMVKTLAKPSLDREKELILQIKQTPLTEAPSDPQPLYQALAELTERGIQDYRMSSVENFFNSPLDLNGDGKVDYRDLLKAWNKKRISPQPDTLVPDGQSKFLII